MASLEDSLGTVPFAVLAVNVGEEAKARRAASGEDGAALPAAARPRHEDDARVGRARASGELRHRPRRKVVYSYLGAHRLERAGGAKAIERLMP